MTAMPLGNNLKKKKLIPDNPKSESQLDNPKKKSVALSKKDSLSKTKKPSGTSSKKVTSVKKKAKPKAPHKKVTKENPNKVGALSGLSNKAQEKVIIDGKTSQTVSEKLPDAIANPKLPVYIAKELIEKKKNLRKRYQEEVASLKEKSDIQFVIITIDNEKYAIEIDNIKEIVAIPDISKPPNTPSHIKGIANVRGKTYVVFDLADKFNARRTETPNYLLVLNDKEINSSLTLSILPSTLKVKSVNISSDLQIIEDVLLDASYIKGLIQNNEELIYYLDIVELIKNEKAIVVPDELFEQVNGQ